VSNLKLYTLFVYFVVSILVEVLNPNLNHEMHEMRTLFLCFAISIQLDMACPVN
jgi:hypothetical protein